MWHHRRPAARNFQRTKQETLHSTSHHIILRGVPRTSDGRGSRDHGKGTRVGAIKLLRSVDIQTGLTTYRRRQISGPLPSTDCM